MKKTIVIAIGAFLSIGAIVALLIWKNRDEANKTAMFYSGDIL